MPVPDKVVPIDGAFTIDQTRDSCVVEQNSGYQLQKIERSTLPQGGAALLVNKAEFVANLDWLPTLLFVEPGPNNPDTIKSTRAAEGWKWLCSGPIYVQNNITNVMVFAK